MGPSERQGTPFPFEGPVPAELLIDREDELDLLAGRAADRVSVRLVAPRRYGKTSLLLAHAQRLGDSDWRAAHVDLSRVADLTDVARRFAAAYTHLSVPWVRAQLSGLLSRLGITFGASGPGISVALRPSVPDAAAAETIIQQLLDLPRTLWEADRVPTLVVFDEFQDLLVARHDLDGLLRSHIQYHADAAAYVYAGSEPSMMRELFDTRERPLFGQADPLTLGPLPVAETIADLSRRFAAEGLDPGGALGEIVAFGAGHPQRTMLLCYLLAEALADGADGTPETAAAVIDDATDRTAQAHQALWGQLGASERAVLAAISDGTAPSSRELARRLRLSRNALDAAADRLAASGHVIREPRNTTLVDPLLAHWLRRR